MKRWRNEEKNPCRHRGFYIVKDASTGGRMIGEFFTHYDTEEARGKWRLLLQLPGGSLHKITHYQILPRV